MDCSAQMLHGARSQHPSAPSKVPLMSSELAPPPVVVAGRPDRVEVRGLHVDAFIGVFDHERQARQRLRFDVEVDTVAEYADIVRLAGEYVSYADIVEYIEARAATGEHVELVETWAEDVALFVLRNELAAAVRVTVVKPDVFAGAEAVGVTIERRRALGVPRR